MLSNASIMESQNVFWVLAVYSPHARTDAGNLTILFGNSASAIQTSIILPSISLIRSGIGTPIRLDVLRRRRIRFWSSASSANPFRRNFTMFGGGFMCSVLVVCANEPFARGYPAGRGSGGAPGGDA